jgi:hypothetical protein
MCECINGPYLNIFLTIFQKFRKNHLEVFSYSQSCAPKEKKNNVGPKLHKKHSVARLRKKNKARDVNKPYRNPTVDRIYRIEGPSAIRMNLRPKRANELRTKENPVNQSGSVHGDDVAAIEELQIDKSGSSGSPTAKVLISVPIIPSILVMFH